MGKVAADRTSVMIDAEEKLPGGEEGRRAPDDESFTALRGVPLYTQSRRPKNLVVIHGRVANGMSASIDLGTWRAGCVGPSWLGSWTGG